MSSSKFPELSRISENLNFIVQTLQLNPPILTEINTTNNKLSATLNLDQGFYDNCHISFKLSIDSNKDYSFHIQSYPIVEFNSILSIVSKLLPRVEFLSKNQNMITSEFVTESIYEMGICEEILTVRKVLTNMEICDDWNTKAFENSPDETTMISVFPFRESLYVTIYQVEETNNELRELRVGSSPFNYSPKSVIKIKGKHYLILHSIVGKQSQQFLSQILRCIRSSISELENILSLIQNNENDIFNEEIVEEEERKNEEEEDECEKNDEEDESSC